MFPSRRHSSWNRIDQMNKIYSTALLAFLLLCAFGCKDFSIKSLTGAVEEEGIDSLAMAYLSKGIKEKVAKGSEPLLVKNRKAKDIDTLLQKFYASNACKWFDIETEQRNRLAEDVLTEMEEAPKHGLDTKDYQLDRLKKLDAYLSQTFAAEKVDTLPVDSLLTFDTMLTGQFFSFLTDVMHGKISPKRWEVYERENDLSLSLTQAMDLNNIEAVVLNSMPPDPGYKAMMNKYAEYLEIKKAGGWPKLDKGSFAKGKSGAHVAMLAKRLSLEGDLDESLNKQDKVDDKIIEAIKSFQKRNKLAATGRIDEKTRERMKQPIEEDIKLVLLNMNRFRWMPEDRGERYIHVNIPDQYLRYYEGEEVVEEMNVVVGNPKSPTPVMFKDMKYIVFSPVWHVPPSIAKDEIIKYAKINPRVILVSDVEVYKNGKKMDPLAIDWKGETNWSNYRFKQKPTANQNALGRVKFIFPNHHSVYMHDTYNKGDFGNNTRAESAGCIRVEDPVGLSYALLADKGYSEAGVSKAMNRGKEQHVNLSSPVPVYLTYFTAYVDETGQLQRRKDLYRFDKKQSKQFEKAGVLL